ncbi:hypothetical protein, partial [Escherichia coli]|uniref:hypothetical protein n=1 Tax=Escherichia coli TaxID=562 RepID=UPI0028DFFB56
KVGWSSILVATLVLGFGVAAEAQQPTKVHRIGFLGNSTAALEANLIGPFREGMSALGYIEGENISLSIDGLKASMNASPN